ncbi:hypothetical protein ECZU06_22760 [Escherichia coli]|nr:hypothetical protein ECZU06_22760 [Escherichia coli]
MYDFFILSRQNEEVRRRLLDEVPMEDWAVALKGTEALLRRSIYAVMPKRQAQQLEAITARRGRCRSAVSNRSAAKSWALPVNWKRRAKFSYSSLRNRRRSNHDH